MPLRKSKLKVHFVFTDLREINEVLEFMMLIKAFYKYGVLCTYECNAQAGGNVGDLNYNFPNITKKPYTKNWEYVDFIIVQKVYRGRPNWNIRKPWVKSVVIVKNINKGDITKKQMSSDMYLFDNTKMYDNKLYKDNYKDKYSFFVSFGFDEKVLKNKRIQKKKNLVLIDSLSFGYKHVDYIDNFSHMGWECKRLAHERAEAYKHKSDYEKAKLLIVSGKMGAINYPVLYAMAMGVLIIKVGENNVNHLNKHNCISCKTMEEAYLVMIRYNNDNTMHGEQIDGGHQYFALTQNIDKNAKHIIESVCRFMYL